MQKEKTIYTVGQVNSLIKEVLENNLPGRLTVVGEISDWKHHQSGHCYFLLKDETGQLPCVMWRSKFSKVKFEPENGIEVLATGFVDVYPPQGKYQFYVESMKPVGVGDLQLAFEQMVKKLEAEGLFRDEYKKPLPKYPQRIGILTSESGAAVGDITESIFNRWPCAKLFLCPVPVQGEGAAEKIAATLKDVNRRNEKLKLDILIVGRGGGSLEDLWAFNEEVLARAIFDSKIPLISAVGHEVDVTIADLVADARASTPTKAGVTAVPDVKEVLGKLDFCKRTLESKTNWKLQLCAKSLEAVLASAVFRNPLLPVQNAGQRLDEFEMRLAEVTKTVINKSRMRFTAVENRLQALNPKLVLKRGYSITTNKKTAALIITLDDAQTGDLLVTELAGDNKIESTVTDKYKTE